MNRPISLLLAASLASPLAAQCYNPSIGSSLGAGDDTIHTVSLGFSFTMPSGATVTSVSIDSNGRITAPGAAGASDFTPSSGEFTAQTMICPYWDDLAPQDGGGLHFGTNGSTAVITWLDTPLFGGGSGPFTVQCELRSNNTFTLYYDQRAPSSDSLCGASAGFGAAQLNLSDAIGGSINSPSKTAFQDFGTFDLADASFDYSSNGAGYLITGTDCMSPPIPPVDTSAPTNLPDDTPANAPSLFVPGLDIEARMDASYQNNADSDRVAVSMQTTACNPGSVIGTWIPQPNPNHPLICQMYLRLVNGRMEQISDWGYVKHSFASTNSNGCGGGCQNPGSGQLLGLNCSDTYGAGLNASRNWAGPSWEINAFTGDWNAFGSHWDRGWPQTTPDGSGTTANAPNATAFRCIIENDKLSDPSAQYFGMNFYIHQWEPEANRENNMSHRPLNITVGNTSSLGNRQAGTVLNRWPGARVESVANYENGVTPRDGRFYVACVVTQLADGWYHYEYAVHNRDNHGRNGQFSVPLCPNARVRDIDFKDIDLDGANEWISSVQSNRLQWDAPAGNAQPWNTVFNFWFDSDAAPGDGQIDIVQATPQINADAILSLTNDAPVVQANINVPAGCGGLDMWPNAQATIPSNPGMVINGAANGATVGVLLSVTQNIVNFGGCDFLLADIPFALTATAGGTGSATIVVPVNNDPGLEGARLHMQGVELAIGGSFLGVANLSNVVEMRIGNNTSGCN